MELLEHRTNGGSSRPFVGRRPVVSRAEARITLVAKCGCGFEHRDARSLQPAMTHAAETGHTVQFHGEIKSAKVVAFE